MMDRKKLKEAFDKAITSSPSNDDQKEQEIEAQRGSDMVRKSQLKPALTPKGEMRRGPDEEAFKSRFIAEQKKAAEIRKMLQEKRERQARDRSRGLER